MDNRYYIIKTHDIQKFRTLCLLRLVLSTTLPVYTLTCVVSVTISATSDTNLSLRKPLSSSAEELLPHTEAAVGGRRHGQGLIFDIKYMFRPASSATCKLGSRRI
jgi:hypothetical protein